MCGRYALAQTGRVLIKRFHLGSDDGDVGFVDWHDRRPEPRFNIAPSQDILVIIKPDDGARRAVTARWGFAPAWIDSAAARRPPPINARAETLASSPMFRDALATGRCLIPATGFYEWRTRPGTELKIPMHIQLESGALFAFAGLWTPGRHGGPPTAAIVTCPANELVSDIHNRMPAILRPEDEAEWLDPTFAQPRKLLRPYPSAQLKAYPVSARVNSVDNEGEELIAPADPPPLLQPSLF